MVARNAPLVTRPGFEKFSEELQVGNSTASGSDWDSRSVGSDEVHEENEERIKYVPLATPCTPWIDAAPRGAFGAGAKEIRTDVPWTGTQTSAASSFRRPSTRTQHAPKDDFRGSSQHQQFIKLESFDAEYGYAPQEYDHSPQSSVHASASMHQQIQQQAQQQQMQIMMMQQMMMQQMHQMQQAMQNQPQDPRVQEQTMQQMQQLQQQWMNAMSSAVPMPVPVPVPVSQLQQPQAQVPFGYQLVRQEKPMLEDLLPGQTRGARLRTTRPKRGESQIGGSSPSKVFVGGLSPHSTAETLRDHFEKFGVITDCAVINEPGTRKSRGFGFVEFAGGIPAGLLEQEHIVGQRRCGVRPYEYTAQAGEETENA